MTESHGMTESPKRVKIFEYLKSTQFDIFLVQETHLPDVTQGKLWEKQWGGQALWSPGTNRYAGVGILFNPGTSIEVLGHKTDSDGRLVVAHLKFGGVAFQIFNVYAPNNHSEWECFFNTLWHYTFCNVQTIVSGDFNCIPDIQKDKWGGGGVDNTTPLATEVFHNYTRSQIP